MVSAFFPYNQTSSDISRYTCIYFVFRFLNKFYHSQRREGESWNSQKGYSQVKNNG